MKKVYLIIKNYSYEGEEIVEIFSDNDTAQSYAQQIAKESKFSFLTEAK